jgi:competence protein ComGC
MTMVLLCIAVLLILLPSIRAKQAKIKARGIADGD